MTADVETNKSTEILTTKEETYKVYKKRWIILTIFVLFSASNSMQWTQYSIITDVITKYYNVSNTFVNYTSMIFMILYIPFIFPSTYITDKWGLRLSVTIGIVGTCVGAWIKVGSVAPNLFWLGFLGQTIVALSQIFVLSVPARLAAVWFEPSQVSLACSIGVFGNQLGNALGFELPSLMVTAKDNETIHHQLFVMFMVVAAYTTVVLLLVLFLFKEKPNTPPSQAQAQQESVSEDYLGTLRKLMTNKSYVLLLISYGINVGVYYAISTLLNQIILKYYKDGASDAGNIGLVMVIAGMVGSVICGFILDRSHRFKETTIAVYALSLIGMIVFTFTLTKGIVVVYITSILLGFFMTGLLPVGFELATELTYPESEGTSAGLLNASSQVFGIAFTNLYQYMFDDVSVEWANGLMCIMLFIGTVMLVFVSSERKRQAAQNS